VEKVSRAGPAGTTLRGEQADCGRLIVRFHRLAAFANHVDEGLNGARQAAVATVDQSEFAPQVDAFDIQKLHFPGLHLIAGETFADDGDVRRRRRRRS